MPKEHVVSFRLDDTKFNALTERMNADKPVGINSENQMARKIIDDALTGRLDYKNQKDREKNFSLLGA